MKNKFFLLFLFLFFFVLPSCADVISGNVRQDDYFNKNKPQVLDIETKKPIANAKVSIPDYDFKTSTDNEGRFELNAHIDSKTVLQIEKNGYRPYSLTIDKNFLNNPMKISIQKSDKTDIFIQKGVFHLGDDVYSKNSANCSQFKEKPIGPYFYQNIKLEKPQNGKQVFLVFGSIIGLDTKLAREFGQNKIAHVYSSPLEVIFNGQIIAEIYLNGDNQKILVPNQLIRSNNDLIIKTGRNLFQYKYIDYDDMEFANLRIEYQDKVIANKS